MSKFLFAALTSLFVSVMPLAAAYAEELQCEHATVSEVINPEINAKIEANGGSLLSFTTPESVGPVLQQVIDIVGSPPPYDVDAVYISHPAEDADNVNILLGYKGCAQGFVKRFYPQFANLFKKA